jgi:ABC-type phosphate transport system substrate-binding protein
MNTSRLYAVFSACVFLFGISTSMGYAQTVAVIAHKSAPAQNLEADKILDIYTLNTKNWADGSKITVFELKGDSPVKSRFYTALNTAFAEMQKIWLKKQFSGKGLPPTAVNSEQELLERVANTPGAIAYVNAETAKSGNVKVLATIK